MSHYVLKHEQLIRRPPAEVWRFFSDPGNLAVITPPYMNFRVTSSDIATTIYPGQIITYKVSPLLGIPLSWITEITHVRDGVFFVDEQRAGPYRLWHHEHHFTDTGNGVLMKDIVHYMLPFSIFGTLAHQLFVKRQLENIFEFRRRKITEIFRE